MDLPKEDMPITGTIAYVNIPKGYGFVAVSGFPKNIFFHVKDVRAGEFDSIRIGDPVHIEGIKETEKGHQALRVYLSNG